MTKLRIPLDLLGKLIFWSWNFAFLALMLAGFTPMVFIELIEDASTGNAPWNFVVFSGLAVLIPVVSTAAGVFMRKSGTQLLRLFYAVETPLFLLCLWRIFGIRELNDGAAFVLGALMVGIASQVVSLKRSPSLGVWGAVDTLFGTVGLFAAGYIAVLVSFFAVPMFIYVLQAPLSLNMWRMAFIPAFFVMVTGTVFCALPVFLTYIASRTWLRQVTSFGKQAGFLWSALLVFVSASALSYGFGRATMQPQAAAFSSLEGQWSEDAAARLLERDEELKKGLLNGYLARARYLAEKRSDRGAIKHLYERELGFSETFAEGVQGLFDGVVEPFLYDGDRFEDRARAKQLYAEAFDRPIQRAEIDAIRRAAASGFDRGDREAGLADAGEQRVHLEAQHVQVEEHGDWAEVEVYERYLNRTYQQEEIFYAFSLPESAVLTGIWLGNTEQRDERFRFTVAPRGAAQAVYKAEVRRRVDPALLEQVGPRQYRLRVFPIPARPWRRSQAKHESMHLWMTYRVVARSGRWAMPRLAQARNVYFDEQTERRINGEASEPHDAWLPKSLPAHGDTEPRVHILEVGGQTMVARPIDQDAPLDLPIAKRFVVAIDRSYSMNAHRDALARELDWLSEHLGETNELTFLLTASPRRAVGLVRQEQVDADQLVFFGGQTHGQILDQIAPIVSESKPDAVFVLTDDGSYEHEEDVKDRRIDAPLFFVHLDGSFPMAYQDATLEAVQRTGGVAGNLAAFFQPTPDDALLVSDGYAFSVTTEAAPKRGSDGFAPFFARQLIRAAVRSKSPGEAQLAHLDRLHAIAQRYEIVSPYSSMLVLVNDRQKEALAKAESEDDRFDREVERGDEGTSITGTPEPEEWLLIGLMMLALFYVARKRPMLARSSSSWPAV